MSKKALVSIICLTVILLVFGCERQNQRGVKGQIADKSENKSISELIKDLKKAGRQCRKWNHINPAGDRARDASDKYSEIEHKIIKNGTKAIPYILPLLEDKNVDIRSTGVFILGELRDLSVVSVLSKALRDKEYLVSRVAAASLTKIGGEPALNELLKALKDKNPKARASAAEYIIRVCKTAAVENALISVMDDSDANVRWTAVVSIRVLKSKKAIPYLLNGLVDKYYQVRSSAFSALYELKVKKSLIIPKLIEAMEMGYVDWTYLSIMTEKNFEKDLAKWREWWEKNKDRILKEEAEKDRLEKEKADKHPKSKDTK